MHMARLKPALRLLIFLPLAAATAIASTGSPVSPERAAAAASELAELLRDNYVYPDIGQRYFEALNDRIETGFGSDGIELGALARDLETVVNGVHRDAHLRVSVAGSRDEGRRRMRRPGSRGAIGTTTWIGEDVAYVELQSLPGDEASQAAMGRFLDDYRGARALVIDARMCLGGTLSVMDVLTSRLYDEPTHLVTMDTRTDSAEQQREWIADLPTLRSAEADPSVIRFEHWAVPSNDPDDRAWADVPVYLLTDMTASACEHLALALKTTDRATLVGNTTRGAGHFGGMSSFADDALEVFLPVGRTYDPATGKDWEGVGVEPDIAVPAEQALERVVDELGLDPALAAEVSPQATSPEVVVRRGNPDRKRGYGIAMLPPRGGDTSIELLRVEPDGVAARAGMQRGDRIVAINGHPVGDLDEESFVDALRAQELTLEVLRTGKERQFKLTLGSQ